MTIQTYLGTSTMKTGTSTTKVGTTTWLNRRRRLKLRSEKTTADGVLHAVAPARKLKDPNVWLGDSGATVDISPSLDGASKIKG